MQDTHRVTPDFKPDGIFVFCREEEFMAKAAHRLYRNAGPCWILLTGGIGKGSGPRSQKFGSEAMHIADVLTSSYDVPAGHIFLETEARNGAENSRLGIDTLRKYGLPHNNVALVMHPFAARRIYATHTFIAREEKQFESSYRVYVADDPFDPINFSHAREVLSEFIRVSEWPDKKWGDLQKDYPHELLPWAKKQLAELSTYR